MNILVTGASGLIGYHLCKRLVSEGNQVVGLVHKRINPLTNSLLKSSRFKSRVGDIRDDYAIKNILKDNKIKTVFHMAAHLPYSPERDYTGVNILGISNLLNSARINGVEDFLFASSISVYSTPPDYLPVDEVHPIRPLDVYGASKLAGELFCNCYSKFMRITILRYAGVYGVGGTARAVFKFFHSALDNEPLSIFGNGKQSSEYVYVDDVVEGTYLAWKKGQSGIYNIGSGQETAIIDLARQIVNLTNSKSKIVLAQKETDRPFRFVSDISKARRDLGYNPMSLSQGLSVYLEDMSGKR